MSKPRTICSEDMYNGETNIQLVILIQRVNYLSGALDPANRSRVTRRYGGTRIHIVEGLEESYLTAMTCSGAAYLIAWDDC